MSERLLVHGATLAAAGNGMVELSALLGKERLWYRVPESHTPDLRGDAFAIAALLPAMRLGIPLEIDSSLPVDPVLLANLERLQRIFVYWGHELKQPFKHVPVIASAEPAKSHHKTMSFFSGGVDGTYTMLEVADKIDEAVFVSGVDFQLDNPVYDEAYKRNAEFLAKFDIPLISMASNLRWVARGYGLPWNSYFGGGLATFAHVLGARTMYLASGYSWSQYWPDGSHPVTDPLWSSSQVEVIHHARNVNRAEKLERIALEPGALDILRVCWQDKGFNCGECEKCIRTMVLLRLLKLESPNFPALEDAAIVATFVPGDRNKIVYVQEALDLAQKVGDEPIANALKKALSRREWRSLLSDAERAWLGGKGKKLLNKLRGRARSGS